MTTINDQFSLNSAYEMKEVAISSLSLLKAADKLYQKIEGDVAETPDLQQAVETGQSVLDEITQAIVDYEHPVNLEALYRKGVGL